MLSKSGPKQLGVIVAKTVTIAKFLSSGFDPEENMFRRRFVGADGYGYDLLRPPSVDRQNLQIESAVASDVRTWLQENPNWNSPVVAYTPRVISDRDVKWLPPMRVARATRSYWRADRQHIFTRVITEHGVTLNIYTPARLIAQALHVFETTDADTRAKVHGTSNSHGRRDAHSPQ